MLPELISSEQILTTKLFNVSRSTLREGEITYQRDLILHSGSAVIIPVFDDKTVALVRQYRHAAQKYLLELPAGSLEKGETPENCAAREIQEEIGYRAEKIELLTEFYVSPGFLNEKMFVFLATELTEVGQNLDDDEMLSVERFSFPEIYQMIKQGEFEDAKTMLGLILAGTRFGFNFANP
ncbi:MAG: NUDIX hydrolase [Pyrinomonadaceae bacterium]|nr:NUDIX hydrolase [Pyrinomonadaceae bacterium]